MLAGLQNVTFEFGARVIVKDATWHIQPNERIGLIGYNGTGKSTLLKVIVGEYVPSKGEVIRSRGISIGYLHQDLLSFDSSDSILRVAMGAFERVLQLEKEIEDLGKILEEKEDEALLMEYSEKLHEIDVLDGYNIHHKTEEVLQGLGFSNSDLERPYQTFSGGWRMRVLLAKMILQKPDLLLLDEPTNHLDLRAKDVLLDAIRNFSGTVLFVSHDRYFIDGLATRVFEVEDRRVHIYPGNYEDYLWRKQGGPEKVTASVTNFIEPVKNVTVPVTDPVIETKKAVVKKLNPIKLKLLEDEVAAAEETIAEWERRIAVAEEKLGVFTSSEDSQNASAELERLRKEHAELLQTWEDLGMQLEEQRD